MIFLLLWGFCFSAFAEGALPSGQPHNTQEHISAVKHLNEMVGLLRDPTLMNANFRKALGRLPNQQQEVVEKDVDENGELLLPEIELVGKVISEDRASTVVFKAKGKYYHFEEGDSLTKVVDHKVITFKVIEISKSRVRVLIMPFNKTLIF